MKKFSVLAAVLFLSLFLVSESHGHRKPAQGWVWKSTSAVANNSGIIHYVWEMARPPYGPFDKIALHRFVYKGDDWRKRPSRDKVLLHLPGTFDTAWKGIVNPDIENHLFFAAHGYDVYSLDYRTSYLPNLDYPEFEMYGKDISSAAYWTYGLFREDIKACVEKIKDISHASKIFLSGFSRGGAQIWIYASKYGKRDIKGLIGLDGGSPFASATTPRSVAEYDAAVHAFLASGAELLSRSTPLFDSYSRILFAGMLPYSKKTVGYATLDDLLAVSGYVPVYGPPPDAINVISDLQAYFYTYSWNYLAGYTKLYGVLTNFYNGQMDQLDLMKVQAGLTYYWPAIQNVERIDDLDYASNVSMLTIPVLFFGGILSCKADMSNCTSTNYKCASTDVTVLTLPGFGHLDVMWGINSREKVKEPMLEWMNRRQ